MPTYTYICGECGNKKEILHKTNEQSEMVCCNKMMRRKFGSPLLEFRGHGFHDTDYRRLEKINKDAREHVKREDPSLGIERRF